MKQARFILLLGTLMLVFGCSTTIGKKYQEPKKRKVFRVASSQLPPEPVYNRLRWAHLPDPAPARVVYTSAPKIDPIMQLKLNNATLEQAANSLARAMRYRSYVAGTIANQRITINTLGTLDELGAALAKKANVHLVIDHKNKEIRVLKNKAVKPEYFSKEAVRDEHK
ncbi:MAG: hypothetical protein D6719_02615 [Candidatus Dadabacteria bacterium]|nr:MAG: hypothetical protein D6719_02615 [Candidatus Dadabacteria bacterium]